MILSERRSCSISGRISRIFFLTAYPWHVSIVLLSADSRNFKKIRKERRMISCLRLFAFCFSRFASNRRRLSIATLALPLFAVLLALPPLLRAQEQKAQPQQPEQQKLPMVEPAETHLKVHIPAFIEASPHISGKWTTLPFMMPINPVHVAMMHTGKVLIIAGSGNDPNNHTLHAGVWDPKTDTMRTFLISYDMFCNGMVILPNGKPFVLGGTI